MDIYFGTIRKNCVNVIRIVIILLARKRKLLWKKLLLSKKNHTRCSYNPAQLKSFSINSLLTWPIEPLVNTNFGQRKEPFTRSSSVIWRIYTFNGKTSFYHFHSQTLFGRTQRFHLQAFIQPLTVTSLLLFFFIFSYTLLDIFISGSTYIVVNHGQAKHFNDYQNLTKWNK